MLTSVSHPLSRWFHPMAHKLYMAGRQTGALTANGRKHTHYCCVGYTATSLQLYTSSGSFLRVCAFSSNQRRQGEIMKQPDQDTNMFQSLNPATWSPYFKEHVIDNF